MGNNRHGVPSSALSCRAADLRMVGKSGSRAVLQQLSDLRAVHAYLAEIFLLHITFEEKQVRAQGGGRTVERLESTILSKRCAWRLVKSILPFAGYMARTRDIRGDERGGTSLISARC